MDKHLEEMAAHAITCDACFEALLEFAKAVAALPQGRVFELVDNYRDEWIEVK